MFIVEIDMEKCLACAECVDNCPEQLIAHVEGKWQEICYVYG